MRAILCAVAVLVMSQPAQACGLDGMFGEHRFNPFLQMQTGAGDAATDAAENLSDDQDSYADQSGDANNENEEQDTAMLDLSNLRSEY